MAKRVAVVLSGCGRQDGSDPAETLFALLVIERAGAQAVCAAPDRAQPAVVDHLTAAVDAAPRKIRAEAARLVGRSVAPLGVLDARKLDGLIVPGGEGAVTTLSDYATKHELCTVDPELFALLRGLLQARRPMGFIGLSALLAARVLGPVAGVRLTLGARGTAPAKHAAIMGADVRPGTTDDVIADQKSRVYSTPGLLAQPAVAEPSSVEPARTLPAVARAIDQLVRMVVGGGAQPRPTRPTDRARGSA